MTNAARGPVERSISRIRLLVMLVGVVLSVPHALDGEGMASIAVLAVALGAVALLPMVTPRAGPAVRAGFIVAIDTAVVLALLGMRSVEPGDPATILLMLPLLEAAFLLGLLATATVWFTMTFATTARLVWSWDGTTDEATGTFQLFGLLLLVSLPAAHLSSHLVDTVAGYARARDVAERRAGILTSLLDATSGMTTLDAPTALRETVAAAATMVSGRALVTAALPADPPPLPTADPSVAVRVLAASFDAGEHVTGDRSVLERAATAGGVGVAVDGTDDGFMVGLGGDHGAGALWATGAASRDGLTRDGLELLASHLRVSLSISALDQQTRAEAAHWERRAEIDQLTGLFNRNALIKRLESSLVLADAGVAVLYIDLDRSKAINDEHGHDVGDEVLVALTARLAHLAPPSALVARLGGDEFAMAVDLPAGDPAGVLTPLVARILDEMRRPVGLARGFDVQLGASVGTAVAEPGCGSSAAELLRAADTRMYETKRNRRSTDHPPLRPPTGEDAGGVPLAESGAQR